MLVLTGTFPQDLFPAGPAPNIPGTVDIAVPVTRAEIWGTAILNPLPPGQTPNDLYSFQLDELAFYARESAQIMNLTPVAL